MTSFFKKFESLVGSVIEEICVGLGPSGELRYVTVTLHHKYEASTTVSYGVLNTGILHILVMVNGSFLELANSSAMTSTCRLKSLSISNGNLVVV